MSNANTENVAIFKSSVATMTAVERRFVEDMNLSPLAYTLIVRMTSLGGDDTVEPGDFLPGVPNRDVDAAVSELVRCGHLEPIDGSDVDYRVSDAPKIAAPSPSGGSASVPSGRGGTALYRYFDHYGRLLYIGITNNPARRRKAHSRTSRWYTLSVGDPTIEWVPSGDALNLEAEAIEAEKPLFNSAPDGSGTALKRLLAYLSEIGRPELLPTHYLNGVAAK